MALADYALKLTRNHLSVWVWDPGGGERGRGKGKGATIRWMFQMEHSKLH